MNDRKTILITGANRGIGFEIARQLGKKEHHVIISGRDEAGLKKTHKQLAEEDINADILLLDVSNPDSINKAAKDFGKSKQQLDVLINNAGIGIRGDTSLLRNSEDILNETLQTNSYGPLRVTKAFIPYIPKGGRIINISSGGGSMSDPTGGWWPAYCVSKTLLNSITRQFAYELEQKDIAVNAVCPGWVRTDMGGMGAPRAIPKGAETPVWLATEAPQHLTGKFFRDKKEIEW